MGFFIFIFSVSKQSFGGEFPRDPGGEYAELFLSVPSCCPNRIHVQDKLVFSEASLKHIYFKHFYAEVPENYIYSNVENFHGTNKQCKTFKVQPPFPTEVMVEF
jgi:hypothetical protein